MSMNYRLLGSHIQSIRKSRGLTQERLAEHLGVTVGYISQIERGVSKVNLDTLSRIAEFLDYEIDSFLTGTVAEQSHYLENEFLMRYEKLSVQERQLVLHFMDILQKNDIFSSETSY